MSYGFTVYTDRASIATTEVYSETANHTYEYDHGTSQHQLAGFTDGDYLRFTAIPADGYEFKQWIYHIGSPDAPTEYSTSNPFTYYGSAGNDIYIAAEGVSTGGGSGGGSTDQTWTLKSYDSQSDSFAIRIYFNASECYRIPVKFTSGGRAKFYCDSSHNSSSPDMIGYISDLSSFYDTYGEPLKVLNWNQDSEENYSGTMKHDDFGFEEDVSADKQYYLFVRAYDEEEESGYVDIYCDAPVSDYFEWSSAVAQLSPVKCVLHTEWNAFIGKIIAVLTSKNIQNQPIGESKYGYAKGTTYSEMLNDCYLNTYDTTLQGYPLTAKKFNVARFIIGSFVSTGIDDKTSRQSEVLASDFHTLENCLKIWQEQ